MDNKYGSTAGRPDIKDRRIKPALGDKTRLFLSITALPSGFIQLLFEYISVILLFSLHLIHENLFQ